MYVYIIMSKRPSSPEDCVTDWQRRFYGSGTGKETLVTEVPGRAIKYVPYVSAGYLHFRLRVPQANPPNHLMMHDTGW